MYEPIDDFDCDNEEKMIPYCQFVECVLYDDVTDICLSEGVCCLHSLFGDEE